MIFKLISHQVIGDKKFVENWKLDNQRLNRPLTLKPKSSEKKSNRQDYKRRVVYL